MSVRACVRVCVCVCGEKSTTVSTNKNVENCARVSSGQSYKPDTYTSIILYYYILLSAIAYKLSHKTYLRTSWWVEVSRIIERIIMLPPHKFSRMEYDNNVTYYYNAQPNTTNKKQTCYWIIKRLRISVEQYNQ